jgi:hypothetical protein
MNLIVDFLLKSQGKPTRLTVDANNPDSPFTQRSEFVIDLIAKEMLLDSWKL